MCTYYGRDIFPGVYQREAGCYTSRNDRRTERFRMENSSRTPRQSEWFSLGNLFVVTVFGFLVLEGCGASAEVPDPIETFEVGAFLADEVVLDVEDSAVKWGAGEVGEELKRKLIENGSFGKVHYPIHPSYNVPVSLKVVAHGTKEEDSTGFVKAFVTGLLFFAPVGVIQYEDKFILTADVSVIRKGKTFGPLKIESIVEVDHTMFSNAERYSNQARGLVWDDFAKRVSMALKEHPDWFSNAK